MSKKTKTFQTFNVDVIKTPEGQIPTVDSFHRVVDGLFGEILDTRKDLAKLLPNLEKELSNLREILAQQMVLLEILNNAFRDLEKEAKEQGKQISKIQKMTSEITQAGMMGAELTEESKKAIAKLIQLELKESNKPIYDSLKMLESEISKANTTTLKKVEKQLDIIKDQIDDMSSKSELQMLEILEGLNQSPVERQSKSTKKKLTS